MFSFGHGHDDDLLGAAFLAAREEQSDGTQNWFKWVLFFLFIFALIMFCIVYF